MTVNGERITVSLEVVPDEDDPYATLSACDALSEPLAQVRVAPNFKLTVASASAWVEGGFGKPR